jgi:hypothetical protein
MCRGDDAWPDQAIDPKDLGHLCFIGSLCGVMGRGKQVRLRPLEGE